MNQLQALYQTPWISRPLALWGALTGDSGLPIYELDRAKVITPYARIFTHGPTGALGMNSWQLAHAIKKADCSSAMPAALSRLETAGFLLENCWLFDWSTDNLRLANGAADRYADVSRTSLAGRVAQGMAILFMEEKGYSYFDRFATFLRKLNAQQVAQKLAREAKKKHGKGVKPKVPDFIFEGHTREKALAEAKGGFISPNGHADIKGALREALIQLNGWPSLLDPQPEKSFAIGTFLREIDDFSDQPSLIAFVDPPPQASDEPIRYPSQLIRRANYAAWLIGMGLTQAGHSLLSGAPSHSVFQLPIIRLDDAEFAFVPLQVRYTYAPEAIADEEFWTRLQLWPYLPLAHGKVFVEVMGIELGRLRLLAQVCASGEDIPLIQLEPITAPTLRDLAISVFRDGTMFGELQFDTGRYPEIRIEKFKI